MPGTDLGLTLPTLADTMADIVAKTATALAAIEDDLAGKITPSEININAALSMNGSYLTNAGAIQFIPGNRPTAVGSCFFDSGEFFMIDNAGPIQITANGSLNAALLGTIVGDYGGTNGARVTYVDATGEYDFTEDPGVWADLGVDDVVLHGSGGTVRLGVDAALSGTREILIKSLPTTGVAFLVYNASTSTLEDGSVTPVTTLAVQTLNVTTSITANQLTTPNQIKHGDLTLYHPVLPALITGFGSLSAAANPWDLQLASGTLGWSVGIPLDIGERVKKVQVAGSGSTTITLTHVQSTAPGGSTTATGALNTDIVVPGTWSNASRVWLSATLTASDRLLAVTVTHDCP